MAAGRVTVNWFGAKVAASVSRGMTARLAVAGSLLRDEIKVRISLPVVKVKGRVVLRSKPGEFPRLETGHLRRSIFSIMEDDHTVAVGSPLDYALYLELGTSRMEPRPYLARTLLDKQSDLERILLAPLNIVGGP